MLSAARYSQRAVIMLFLQKSALMNRYNASKNLDDGVLTTNFLLFSKTEKNNEIVTVCRISWLQSADIFEDVFFKYFMQPHTNLFKSSKKQQSLSRTNVDSADSYSKHTKNFCGYLLCSIPLQQNCLT